MTCVPKQCKKLFKRNMWTLQVKLLFFLILCSIRGTTSTKELATEFQESQTASAALKNSSKISTSSPLPQASLKPKENNFTRSKQIQPKVEYFTKATAVTKKEESSFESSTPIVEKLKQIATNSMIESTGSTSLEFDTFTTLSPKGAQPNPAVHSTMRLEERLASLDCDLPLLPTESRLWRGNETHELNLPLTTPEDCAIAAGSATSTAAGLEEECPPVILSWEGSAEIQSGDILIVRIADFQLVAESKKALKSRNVSRSANNVNNASRGLDIYDGSRVHRTTPQPAVYQVTRQGLEHCDVTEGVLLDITPLAESGVKIVTLYDKDLAEGINLLIVVSETWGGQCVRLKVTVKSDNCGDSQDCSGKGVCYSNVSMEGYECECCPGFTGPRCEERDACAPSPCDNSGICVDLSQGHDGDTYQCLCPYGYTGKNCDEVVDPCNPSPCLSGGTCEVIKGSENATARRCLCPEGWAGPRCELPAATPGGACAKQPCLHGICVEKASVDTHHEEPYRCFCQPGFAGTRCEYEYNECESSPCANGGTCTDRVGGFDCSCGRGYTGRTCQLKVDLCSPNPCPLHRYCIDRGNSYACECPRGFTGIDCSIPARAACDNNPCAHGGTCWSGVDSFYCACRPGYTGKLCEEDFVIESVFENEMRNEDAREDDTGGGAVRQVSLPLALYHDRLHNVYIAAGTLGAAIAIVGLVVTACHCRVNKTYERLLSRMRRVRDASPPHHWLQDKRAPLQPPQQHRPPIETADMYYTLDFSDNQSSPLIQ